MSAPDEVKEGLETDHTAVDGTDALSLAAPQVHEADDDDDVHGEKKDDQPASRRFFPR